MDTLGSTSTVNICTTYVLLGPADHSDDEDITPTYTTRDNGGHLLG